MAIENLAILFTDIVGSTELSQRLSADAADEVRRGHFSILRQAIAEAGGTEVKNLGDGVMVVFASASAAFSCAVAMQQGVEWDNRLRAHSVGLRVGLSGGEVSREEGDYFGDPVVEAARLCAACGSGQVLSTDVVRLMAGRRNRHQCRSLGALPLKGLAEPVETLEVLWEPFRAGDDHRSIPLPGRLAVRPSIGVVGRDAEIQTMIDATKRVAAGEGREVLLVSGEAGLGKSTLVAEVARTAFDNGACVVLGHCEEDLATPYQLFGEALGHYVTHAPEDQLRAHVEAHGSELSRLVPALASRIPDLPPSKATDSDTERFLLFAAVVGLLAAVSQHQVIVLALEDLQWADKASLLLLRHVIAAEQPMRVLVLGSFRDNELSRAHPFLDTLAALRRQTGVARLELAGLDDSGVVAFLEAAAGQMLDDAGVGLAHAVYRETDGNPFFVSEVLRHLADTGAIFQDPTGQWTAEDSPDRIALPDSVREVIGARVGRLGAEAERVLSLAAVIGGDFDLDLLARTAGATEDEVLDILEAAVAASLVRELTDAPGHYNFAHALIQHTLYEDLGLTRRARAHRQVAKALEEICVDRPGSRVGELARHWTCATQPADLAKAISYSRQAGDAALRALAPGDALHYFAQALDLYPQATNPDPALGLDLSIGLGTAQRQAGDPAFRDTLFDAARRAADLDDTARLVAATQANDRGFFSIFGNVDTEKIAVLEAALQRLPSNHPSRALTLANLCKELAVGTPFDHRQALADEAIALAEATGDDAVVVTVLNHVGFPLLVPSLLEQSLARSAESLERAERLGDPALLFWSATLRGIVAAYDQDIDELDRCFEWSSSIADDLHQPSLNWVQGIRRAGRALIAGDANGAERLASEALGIGSESGEPDAGAIFGPQLIGVAFERGTLGQLVPLIESSVEENPTVPAFSAALALAYVEDGSIDLARQLLERFETEGFELPNDFIWLTGMTLYAEAATECREPRFAGPLFQRLVTRADLLAFDGITCAGPVSHYAGDLAAVLGRYDEADALFAKSCEFSRRVGAEFYAARTDLSWGRMLIERNAPTDVDRARELLTKAHARAVARGFENVERRAAASLQRVGG